MCLTVLFDHLSPGPPLSSSWSGTLYFILDTPLKLIILFFSQYMPITIANRFAVVPRLCHLFLISLSLSQLTNWKSVLYLNTTRPPTDSRKQTDECFIMHCHSPSKGKGSPYSNTERRVLELIPVLGSQPASDVNHKPGGRLLLLSVRPAVTPATLKRAATNFAAW